MNIFLLLFLQKKKFFSLKRNNQRNLHSFGWTLILLMWCLPAQAQVLQRVQASHRLACGVVQGMDDWSGDDIHGDLSALGAEICRAVAVAVLGDEAGLSIVPFPGEIEALGALRGGQVQLAVGLQPSVASAVQFGLRLGPVVFYDSQRLLVSRRSGITRLEDLRDRLICAMDLRRPERNLRDVMTARGISYGLMSHSEQGEMDAAIAVRRCDAGTAMESRLAQSRANFHAATQDFVFLPERLSLDPVVAASPSGDERLGLVLEWTVHALVEAEALGITRAALAVRGGVRDLRTDQLMGRDFATAQALGLSHDWAARVIAATGNYGEIFARTLGGPYGLERGPNALWTEGGLMRPFPMR